MKYFKVVDNIVSDTFIDTEKSNYSLTLTDIALHSELLTFVTQSSNQLDLPFDFYASFNNNLVTFGNLYLQNLPKSKNGQFEISELTNNEKHSTIFVKESNLIRIVEGLDKLGINMFPDGFYLWEKIYEDVRLNHYNDKPKREKSFFLFDNIENCKYYIDKHKKFGQICEVEIIQTTSLFKADMNLLDIIPNHYTYKQAVKQVDNYWAGRTSNNAIFEYLFQGTCKLKPLLHE